LQFAVYGLHAIGKLWTNPKIRGDSADNPWQPPKGAHTPGAGFTATPFPTRTPAASPFKAPRGRAHLDQRRPHGLPQSADYSPRAPLAFHKLPAGRALHRQCYIFCLPRSSPGSCPHTARMPGSTHGPQLWPLPEEHASPVLDFMTTRGASPVPTSSGLDALGPSRLTSKANRGRTLSACLVQHLSTLPRGDPQALSYGQPRKSVTTLRLTSSTTSGVIPVLSPRAQKQLVFNAFVRAAGSGHPLSGAITYHTSWRGVSPPGPRIRACLGGRPCRVDPSEREPSQAVPLGPLHKCLLSLLVSDVQTRFRQALPREVRRKSSRPTEVLAKSYRSWGRPLAISHPGHSSRWAAWTSPSKDQNLLPAD